MYKRSGKRILDISISVIGLIILSPLFLFLTILLFFTNNGKPFFQQPRPGLNNVIFKVVKFGTMTNQKDLNGELLPDDQRVTLVGKFLRNTSLDEIPQLWNVLIGEMSLIGPRPLLVEYLPLYNLIQSQRHFIKPGITGWAQVNGRNAIEWKKKFEYDVWYVENLSFGLDIKILFLTILKVTSGKRLKENILPQKFTGQSDN